MILRWNLREPPGLAHLLIAVGTVTVFGLVMGGVGTADPPSVDPDASATAGAQGPLPFHYDILTFKGTDGGTDVVAAVAVPVRRLGRDREDGQVRYRFDVRFVLADTVQKSVIDRIDSVFVSVPRPLARRHLLHTAVELNAPPSTDIQQRIVVTDVVRPGYGQLYQSDLHIPDYGGTDLMVSDIAFGLPGARGAWTRRGLTLALLPTSQFPESAFDVYYEIYNLPPGRPYETVIAIEPVDDDEERVVRTLFEGRSDAGDDGIMDELRRVESALDGGRYRISVTVTDQADGRSATSSRLVEVQGWRRGATMVPALSKRGGRP
ncbi:MAG: hypothetical protein R3304_11845 [Longimicrobiales bacterium]|nr:hypothetical protein [Longimicrobiales bacterium]